MERKNKVIRRDGPSDRGENFSEKVAMERGLYPNLATSIYFDFNAEDCLLASGFNKSPTLLSRTAPFIAQQTALGLRRIHPQGPRTQQIFLMQRLCDFTNMNDTDQQFQIILGA